MNDKLISVIMSVYNETIEELESSVNSILAQTYKKLEFIIIDDNPSNPRVRDFLKKQTDTRIRVIYNTENKGLVYSLNLALGNANGSVIARMDADDIAENTRLEKEFFFLKKNDLDLVGSWINLIDTKDNIVGQMEFPTTHEGIIHQIKYGGCLAHPTWLGKKDIFTELNGYRTIPFCEDYDFLLRAIKKGYNLGNVPCYCLNYRIRENGISNSNKNRQIAIRRYLAKNRKQIDKIDISKYLDSDEFSFEIHQLDLYELAKKNFRDHKPFSLLKLLKNKNLYSYLQEKYINAVVRRFIRAKGNNENKNQQI